MPYYNIERSAFRRGEYVGYANGAWGIKRSGKFWIARRQTTMPGDVPTELAAYRLREISAMLASVARSFPPTTKG